MSQGDGFDRVHGTGQPSAKPLGPSSKPEAPPDEPEWRPCENPRFEINRKGQLRTKAQPLPQQWFPTPFVHVILDGEEDAGDVT